MGKVLNFINENAIVASLIVLFITIIKDIIFKKNDRRYNEKQKNKDESKEQFLNKAELHIEDKQWDSKEKPDISLFMTDFKPSINDNDDVEFHYSKDVLKKEKYKHLKFYVKNIGKADINQLDICVTSQKSTMLCDVDSIKSLVDNKFICYSYCYDRKIQKNEVILIDIAYLESSYIFHTFSCELVLLFRDSYNNLYKQPFFIQESNLYEPHKISNDDYRLYTLPDIALECFKNPWMW